LHIKIINLNKKEKIMAFNFTAPMEAFNNEQAGPMLTEAVLSLKTFDHVKIQYGVTYQEPLNLITSDPTISCSFGCPSWVENSSTTFAQRLLTVDQLISTDSWCFDALKKYWMFNKLTPGSTQVEPDVAFFTMLKDVFLKGFSAQLEKIIWQGNSGSNACTVDGFISQISQSVYDGEGIILTDTTGSISSTTAVSFIMDAVATASAAIMSNSPVLYIGTDTERALIANEISDSKYVYIPGTIEVPGFPGITVATVPGLDGTGVIVLTTENNLWIGMDEIKDINTLQTWYEAKDDKTYVRVKVKLGTQFAFPGQIVTNLAALA
jgi:hypothetical protein